MAKVKKNKTVHLDAKFLPKRKRVLNGDPVVAHQTKRPRPAGADPDPSDDENALDSQNSISSIFWDSQGHLTPTASPMKSDAAPPVDQAAQDDKKVTAMAEIVLQSLREATELMCQSCRDNEHLQAVLARALESAAAQLVKNSEHPVADTRNI